MKQNKNRGLWLAGTVCAALAAIACLIVEYGYEKSSCREAISGCILGCRRQY